MTAQLAQSKIEYNKNWKLKNPEKVLVSRKRYEEKNREKIRERMKKWRINRLAKDPDFERDKARAWVEKNRTARRAYMRQWIGYPEATRPEPTHCECCGRKSGRRGLHLDHCHETKVFRGWLCGNCNTGIGLLGDSLETLLRAVGYLRKG
jgi:hypothetical protein